MPNVFDSVPVESGNVFDSIPAEQPQPDLSKIGTNPLDVYKLQESKSPNLEDYSLAVPPSLNPNYDFLRATHGETILAPPLALLAKGLGSKNPEEAPFKPLVEFPTVSDEDLKNLPSWASKAGRVVNEINKTLTEFTAPVSLAKLPVSEGMAIPFGAQLAADIPGDVQDVVNSKDSDERTSNLSKLGIKLAMGAMLAHGYTKGEPKPSPVQGPYSLGRYLNMPKGAEPPLSVEGFEPLDAQSGSPLSPAELLARQRRVSTPPEAPEPEIKTWNLDEPPPSAKGWEELLKPNSERDLKDEGVTPENIKALLSGSKTPEQVVDEQLGIKKYGNSTDASTMIVEENPDGSRSIGFAPEAGPASTTPVNIGQMSHEDAIAMARQQGVERIKSILNKGGKNAPQIRQQPESNQPEHSRDAGERTPAQPSSGGGVEQRAEAPQANEPVTPPGDVGRIADQEASQITKQISDVSQMSGKDFSDFSRKVKGGMTGEAWRLGQSVESMEQLADLKSKQDAEAVKFQEAKKSGDLEAMSAAAVKRQFFREAYEAATGTGSAGKSLRDKNPNYKPPFPEGSEIQSAAIKVGDKIITGENHVAAYENARNQGVPDTSGATEGFVTKGGKFLNREEAAKSSGVTTTVEPGKLHTEDLSKSSQPVGMGAATPSEFNPTSQFTTSTKNAVVDRERAERGLAPLMKVARDSFGNVWDNAMRLIDNDSQIGQRLTKEINQTGRLVNWLDTDTQNAILLHERISLRNSLDKSLENLKRSVDDGYEPGIEENRLLSAQLSDDLQELDSASRLAGTQLGRGLNARRMMANEDYSLAAMETRKRAANGGNPLTDEQRAEIQSLNDKLKTQQEAYEKHVAELQSRISELEAKREVAAIVEDVKKQFIKTKPEGTRDLVMEQINIKQGIEEKVAEGKPITELGNWIQRLAKNFVEMGVRDSDKLVDSVHGILKEIIPTIDRRQVMDAISGYGDFKQLSKDEISVELRRMKGELQQLGKIEDLQAKKPPLKSGMERRTPSILERQRIKIVNELKRKLGIVVTDPAKQLQSALGAIKTRLQHEIDDLDFQIRTKERLVKTKTPTPLDAEAVELKTRRDALKKQFDEVFGPRQMTDEQRIQLAHRQLDARIAEVERQLKSGEIFPKGKQPSKTPVTPELTAKQAALDVLKEQRDWARDLIQPKDVPDAALAEERKLSRQIEELERQIRNREVFPKGRSATDKPTNATIEAQQKTLQELKARREGIRGELQPGPERDPGAIALRAAKTRLKNRIAELQWKLAKGDFSKRTRTPIVLDEAGNKLRAEYEKTKEDFERGLIKDRLANRSRFEKLMDGISKWRRTFVLSYPSILSKLTSASGELIGITPAEEAIGGVISKIPVLSKVAEKSPRQAGFSLRAEIDAIAGTWRNLFKSAAQKFKTGQSDIDVLYGDSKLVPRELKDYISNIHGALKEPARQNEFYRSFRKRMDFAARSGVDITDPLVQSKIGFEAYKDANRQIFMENNMLADAFNRALTRFSQVDKATGKPSAIGKAAQTFARYELPIVKIPLNIVKRAFEYSFGTAIGSARLARAMINGLDNLHPEEADVIIRNLKRGSLGLAMVGIGFFNPENVGGYYQKGGKRDPRDVKAGGLRVFGADIPPALIHNPLLEQLQIGATIRRVADSKLRKKDQGPQGYASGIMAAYGGLIEEAPFVRQAEDSLKALNPTERHQFLGELLKSTVPGVAQWAAQQLDRDARGNLIQRKPVTPTQYFESAVPGLRQNVPTKAP